MDIVLGPLIGGLLAIAGGITVAITSDRRERRRWHRDEQLKASVELLTSLQTVVRRLIELAYLPDKSSGATADADASSGHRSASNVWNSAMYSALLVCPPELAVLVPALDREVDRLKGEALARQWVRQEFRAERVQLGRLAAQYLRAARGLSGLPDIELASVWTWEGDLDMPAAG